jgi:hypothetical protein
MARVGGDDGGCVAIFHQKTEISWHDERDGVMGWGEDNEAMGAWNDGEPMGGGRWPCRAKKAFLSCRHGFFKRKRARMTYIRFTLHRFNN